MNDTILTVHDLQKRIKDTVILDHVSFSVERGKVYGLVGNNGAGKTTLLRIISGLSYPTGGHIELFGGKSEKELMAARKKTGFLIESPVYCENMPPYQNLVAQSMTYGKADKKRIEYLMDLVGLPKETRKHTPAHVCSFGQKQRYGIAFALLNSPEFLVLDEPLSGLDPKGINEILMLLKQLNEQEGITILVSSNLLSRIYRIATDYIFIDRGKLLSLESRSEIQEKCKPDVTIKTSTVDKTVEVLESGDFGAMEVVSRDSISLSGYDGDLAEIEVFLKDKDIDATVSWSDANLDQYFLSMVEEAARK